MLAKAAGCSVTAIHVDHGLRAPLDAEADRAGALADVIGVSFRRSRSTLQDGSNLEARARAARRDVLPSGSLTGHTADDQAETMLINLLRGAGTSGLAGIRPGPTKPILALRRSETRAVCDALGLDVVDDPSNADRRFVRNRIRAELMPLLDDIAGQRRCCVAGPDGGTRGRRRDSPRGTRRGIDATDAKALTAADRSLARRAVRQWLTGDGYPPDLSTVDRVLEVARGIHRACEVGRGRRVERKDQRLRIVEFTGVASKPGMGSHADGDSL